MKPDHCFEITPTSVPSNEIIYDDELEILLMKKFKNPAWNFGFDLTLKFRSLKQALVQNGPLIRKTVSPR